MIEVHGSIEWSVCPECGGKVGLDRVIELVEAAATEAADGYGGAPECQACVTPLKPDVVLFGEMLPEAAMADGARARRRGRPDALHRLLARGPPGRGATGRLPLRAGGRVALVTQGPTPYDDDAVVKLDGDVVDELEARARRTLAAGPRRYRGRYLR